MTNIILITNFVWMITTNPVPVVQVQDWTCQSQLYIQGFDSAVPLAAAWAVFMVVKRAMRSKHGFPSGGND
jgi:hypothetical protein